MQSPGPGQAVLDWLQTGANGPLVVVLLLMGWLWMLVRRRGGDQPVRRVRPEPLTLDELGRTVFKAAMLQDIGLWRDLFVNGAEARGLLGDGATPFLERRTPEVLDEVLRATIARVPTGATYGGLDQDKAGRLALIIELPNGGGTDLAPLGHAVQVGRSWRLWGGKPG